MKPMLFSTEMVNAILANKKNQTRRVVKPQIEHDVSGTISKPKYQIGDILWVRETWGNYGEDNPESNACYYLYRADYPDGATGYWYEPEHINWCDFPKWRPSIFMPRKAARLFLRVTGVRAEQLQDITEGDAEREGTVARHDTACSGTSARIAYAELWDSPNDKRGYGWNINPYIWVISFERIDETEGAQ